MKISASSTLIALRMMSLDTIKLIFDTPKIKLSYITLKEYLEEEE